MQRSLNFRTKTLLFGYKLRKSNIEHVKEARCDFKATSKTELHVNYYIAHRGM